MFIKFLTTLLATTHHLDDGELHTQITPPPNVKFANNPTVFGQILRGELPVVSYGESETLFAFRDKTPRAPLHALVIPKRHIPTVKDLNSSQADVALIEEMSEMALSIIREHEHEAFRNNDYLLRYHIPPYNSVDHLHLHVLAPASKMSFIMKFGKYLEGTLWCQSDRYVIDKLKQGETV